MPYEGDIRQAIEIGFKGGRLKYIWAICKQCGEGRWVQYIGHQARRRNKNNKEPLCKTCSKIGDKHPKWKGGRRNVGGYIKINLEPTNFFFPMVDASNYVFEHRLVLAKHINRCLLPWEVVHHKNGIKNDNRIENLELITDKRYHMIDVRIKSYIKQLEKENIELKEKLRKKV